MLGTLTLLVIPLVQSPLDAPPVELGRVAWTRDHEAGFARAREEERPVLLLFQEIPGCATCRSFGRGPLSHPLIVAAIESSFVPVAVYNNRAGADAQLLRRYGEPAWNNPVVRFFAPDGDELLGRRAGLWSEHDVAGRMIAALEAAGEDVPAYLRVACEETAPARLERAVFVMHCFWKGEAVLGALPGVRSTRAGWIDRGEAVEIHYDPEHVSLADLARHARSQACADRVYVTNPDRLAAVRDAIGDRARVSHDVPHDAGASDRKHYLGRSPLRFVPLTPLQATRVNAALERGDDATAYLTPHQRELLAAIQGALAKDENALAALVPPLAIPEWAAYERLLATRIAEAGAPKPTTTTPPPPKAERPADGRR